MTAESNGKVPKLVVFHRGIASPLGRFHDIFRYLHGILSEAVLVYVYGKAWHDLLGKNHGGEKSLKGF